jgi:hypothetical protein
VRRLRIVDVAAILGIALGVFLCAIVVLAMGRILRELFGF